MNTGAKKIVMAAMFAAIICIATFIVKIPTPMRGYMNLGDCAVLLAGWLLSPGYGFLAAGLGSALADVFGGYAVYAPATFVIKGIMAVVAHFGFRALSRRIGHFAAWLVSGLVAEVIMVLGYYGFEGVLYGFGPSAVNIPANAIQGAVGLVVGLILVRIFHKNKISSLG
ncbi:MAG: ECF transporter S component [Clostridiales bacterium]|nr:ECF transporter S component [Clostridiales bacterium]